jgi:hypothetical protein
MTRWWYCIHACLSLLLVTWGFLPTGAAQQQPVHADLSQFLDRYCLECHNTEAGSGGLALDAIAEDEVALHPKAWEEVVRKLSTRQMPPARKPRPDEPTYDAIVATLE